MRQIIISILGLLIIVGGYFGMEQMAATERPEPKKAAKAIPTVFTEVVKNGSTPVTVTASGNLALAISRGD